MRHPAATPELIRNVVATRSVLGSGGGSADRGPPTAAGHDVATQVVLLPYPSDLPVRDTEQGDCTFSHVDSSRPNAYLCWGAGDPCIADPDHSVNTLLCLAAPDDSSVVAVIPTTLDDSTRPAPTGDPWLLDLADGERCAFAGGATFAVGDMRANYSCPTGWLLGDPDRSTPQSTILLQPAGSNELTPVGITRAIS